MGSRVVGLRLGGPSRPPSSNFPTVTAPLASPETNGSPYSFENSTSAGCDPPPLAGSASTIVPSQSATGYDTGPGLDVPLHLLGWKLDLDKRIKGVPGAADRAPHALVQEFLNRANTATWAILPNGQTLRILRDSSALIGQSYVEFDLETIFDGELFPDFVALYLLCHETRFAPPAHDDPPTASW